MSAGIALDTRTEIETPENVTLTFQVAGPGSRMGAFLLDLSVRIGVCWLMLWASGALSLILGGSIPTMFILLGLFLMEWGYGTLFEGLWRGQTPGKRVFKLRVVKEEGYPIGFYDAVLRNLLRTADILPIGYAVGLICMACTRRLQRIGDLAAGTMVVRDQVHRFERNSSAFSDLEPILPNECSGRFAVSERTLDAIEQLLWRREQLARRRIDEIASILATPLAEGLGYQLEEESANRDILFLRRVLRTFSSIEQGDQGHS